MIASGRIHSGTRQSCELTARRAGTRAAVVIIGALFELIACCARAADLSSAVIRGSSVYSAADLFAVYRDALGEPITVEGTRAIVTALAAKYELDGYAPPHIRVNDSLTPAGVLRIDVLETRIGDVSISGDPGPHRARLEELSAHLTGQGPVRQESLEGTLRRIRELPGLSVTASTALDGDERNVYRLDLDASFDPLAGAVRVSNRGTDEVGPEFVLGQAVVNGLLGGKANVGLLFGAALDYDEYHGMGMFASVGVGDMDGRFAATGFRSRSNPRETIVDRDDSYVRDRVSFRYTRPLARATPAGVTLFGGLDLDDLTIRRSGAPLRDERLRMLELGASMTWQAGAATQYAAMVELVHGVDGLGSGLIALDLASDPRSADFTLTRLTFVRATRLAERWTLRLDGFAQTSAYVLPYNERFKIGGDRLGRGFEVAEIAGDHGVGAKLELRRRLPAAPAALGRAALYGFYDIGAAWRQDVPGRESAATAGIGFAAQGRRASGTVEVAQPLTRADVEGNTGLSVFAELSIDF